MPARTTPARLLREVARSTPCPDPVELAAADADLRSAMARIRRALGSFDQTEHAAWAMYARTVDRAIVHLEAELNVSEAELAVDQAVDDDAWRATLEHARTSWTAIGDDLRLQAHLAQLDAQDRIDEASSGLRHLVLGAARRATRELDVARDNIGRTFDRTVVQTFGRTFGRTFDAFRRGAAHPST